MPHDSTSPPISWLRVAHVVRPQGRHGEVIADLLTDFPERFTQAPIVHLRAPATAEPEGTATVERSRPHGGRVVLKLAGYDSIPDAERLRGYDLVVPWAERMPLAEDEIYVADLTGAMLVEAASGQPVGAIIDVDRESTNSVLLVVERDAGELLVPFVKAWSPRWDAEARTLVMSLPNGLLDLASTPSDDATEN